jgi:hypothetical protein
MFLLPNDRKPRGHSRSRSRSRSRDPSRTRKAPSPPSIEDPPSKYEYPPSSSAEQGYSGSNTRFANRKKPPETDHHIPRNIQRAQHLTRQMATTLPWAAGPTTLPKRDLATCNRQTNGNILAELLETQTTTWHTACPRTQGQKARGKLYTTQAILSSLATPPNRRNQLPRQSTATLRKPRLGPRSTRPAHTSPLSRTSMHSLRRSSPTPTSP